MQHLHLTGMSKMESEFSIIVPCHVASHNAVWPQTPLKARTLGLSLTSGDWGWRECLVDTQLIARNWTSCSSSSRCSSVQRLGTQRFIFMLTDVDSNLPLAKINDISVVVFGPGLNQPKSDEVLALCILMIIWTPTFKCNQARNNDGIMNVFFEDKKSPIQITCQIDKLIKCQCPTFSIYPISAVALCRNTSSSSFSRGTPT